MMPPFQPLAAAAAAQTASSAVLMKPFAASEAIPGLPTTILLSGMPCLLASWKTEVLG
jgi:hypothetical protein